MIRNTKRAFREFTDRLKLLVKKRPDLITLTLSNIFTMRLIGNKTHGDLAEIGIAEFINQYMYDFQSVHVGKDLYRAKSQEEDITVTNDLTKELCRTCVGRMSGRKGRTNRTVNFCFF